MLCSELQHTSSPPPEILFRHTFAFFYHSILMAWLNINELKRKQIYIKYLSKYYLVLEILGAAFLCCWPGQSRWEELAHIWWHCKFSLYTDSKWISCSHDGENVKFVMTSWKRQRTQIQSSAQDAIGRLTWSHKSLLCVIQTIAATMIMVWYFWSYPPKPIHPKKPPRPCETSSSNWHTPPWEFFLHRQNTSSDCWVLTPGWI